MPQMKDQGFAVSPGTHTLVGVKQYKVIFHVICFVLNLVGISMYLCARMELSMQVASCIIWYFSCLLIL